jgi:hypothetical protein
MMRIDPPAFECEYLMNRQANATALRRIRNFGTFNRFRQPNGTAPLHDTAR